MRSKTSFFNSSIIKKDILRFWPIWSIFFVLLQLAFTITTVFELSGNKIAQYTNIAWQKQFLMNTIRSNMSSGIMILMIASASIITAAAVFGYMNRSRSAYMIHSLPLKRETLFGSHFIAGFLMLLVPVCLTWLFISIISSSNNLAMGAAILEYLLESVIALIFFYSLSCFVMHLCGNEILSIIVYGVINFAVIAASWIFDCIRTELSLSPYYGTNYSIFGSFSRVCTPVYALTSAVSQNHLMYNFDTATASELEKYYAEISGFSFRTFGTFALYLIPAAVFIILAIVIYKKRPVENVGNLLVFKWSVPVFRFVFVFFASLLISAAFYLISSEFLKLRLTYGGLLAVWIVYVIVGVFISYIICDMILARSFKVWKKLSVPQMLIIAIIMGALIFAQKNNTMKPPADNPEDVSLIQLSMENNNISFVYKDEKDIASIMEFEKEMYEINRKDLKELTVSEVNAGNAYTFEYLLKEDEDKIIQRSFYSISGTHEKEFLISFTDFLNKPENSINATCLLEGNEDYIENIFVDLNDFYYEYSGISGSDPSNQTFFYDFESSEQKSKLLAAIRQDIIEGNLKPASFRTGVGTIESDEIEIGNISINLKDEFFDENEPVSRHYGVYLDINEKCSNILELIKSL